MKSDIEQSTRPLKPGDFQLGSLASRAAARAMMEAKKRRPNIIHVTSYARDPSLPRELVSSFTDKEGLLWEVRGVPFQGSGIRS